MIDTDLALQKVFLHLEYNKTSQDIKIPCIIFIISVETIKLIGIIVFNNKKYVKKIIALSMIGLFEIKIKLS